MLQIKSFINRYSIFIYFIMAYLIAWGGILFFAGRKGFQPAAIELSDGFLMFLAMIAGPSLTSLILHAILNGRSGLASLFSRMGNWQVKQAWWIIALLTIPILSSLVLVTLSFLVSPTYKPELSLTRMGMGLVVGLLAGFFEESGWTGFALPCLLSRFSVLKSGLILGLLWACWHGMADFWGNFATSGSLWLPNFILFWLIPLTAYRVLMVWVYKNTNSLLVAQVMHAIYSGTLFAISPSMPVSQGMLWEGVFSASLWIIVVMVITRFNPSVKTKPVVNDMESA